MLPHRAFSVWRRCKPQKQGGIKAGVPTHSNLSLRWSGLEVHIWQYRTLGSLHTLCLQKVRSTPHPRRRAAGGQMMSAPRTCSSISASSTKVGGHTWIKIRNKSEMQADSSFLQFLAFYATAFQFFKLMNF